MRILYFIAICFASLSSNRLIAQLSDNFSDGDYTSNPTWNGNTDLFSVNLEGQLQTIGSAADTAFLFTSFSNTSLVNKEWQFFIRQTFAGSANNNSRVYLTSSATPINYNSSGSAGVQGYFLRFGESGSADAIRLFKDNGTNAPTELAACSAGAISASFSARVKVTRSNTGLWTIFVDYTGGNTFVQEATATDNDYTTSSNLGVICTYTASNADNFFFDDFYFGDFIIDTTPPTVTSVQAINANQLELLYSEPVSVSATITSNYQITGNLNPTSAVISATNPALVTLTFSNPFPQNTDLNINVSGVQDLAGNTMTASSTPFTFFVPATPNVRSVVFNEILADPTPSAGLPEVEFVELHNPTNEFFNLENWTFVNSTTSKTLPSYNLPPNGFVILTDANNAALFTNVIGITSFTALNNTTDSLTLLDNAGNIIDVLVYSVDWFASNDKADGGWTLEQINPQFPCSTASNWSESIATTGGTPGSQNSTFNTAPDIIAPLISNAVSTASNTISISFNETMDTNLLGIAIEIEPNQGAITLNWTNSTILSIQTEQTFGIGQFYDIIVSGPNDCSGNQFVEDTISFIIGYEPELGDLIITEIMAAPSSSIGAYRAEYAEIYNRSNKIIELANVKLNNGSFVQPNIILPGEYLALASANNASLLDNIENIQFMTSFPALTNSGSILTLSHLTAGVLDVVEYSESWYNDDVKDNGGWSLELINPLDPCSSTDNWSASNALEGGTPGLINSIFDVSPDVIGPQITNFTSATPSSIIAQFNEPLGSDDTSDFIVTITPSLGNVTLELLSTESISIQTELPFEVAQFYDISISGPVDCWANEMIPITIPFVIGFQPEFGDIIINEIMADPDIEVGAYAAEYVEIFNRSTKLVDISNLGLNNGRFNAPKFLLPGEYLAIANANDETLLSNISNIAYMTGFPSLTNAGLTLQLTNNDNVTIDSIAYSTSWYNDFSKQNGGWSIELINPEDPCSDSDNWRASMSSTGGTPGVQNSVFDNSPDVTGPQITFVYSGGPFVVAIEFNEPLDEISTENFSWTVNGEQITSVSASFLNDNRTLIGININGGVPSQVYNFVLSPMVDCWGNVSNNLSGIYAIVEPAIAGDIIINEILSDPYDGGADFIELYNKSDKVLGLLDWALATEEDGIITSIDVLTILGVIMLPKQYLVITKDGSDLPGFYPFTKTDRILRVLDMPAYNNTEGTVVLIMPDSTISDRVQYTEDMHFVLLDDLDGVSLERIDPARPASDITNWGSAAESQGFATPGYQNSQALAAILGEEDINVFPEIFSPDNDGFEDVVTFTFQNTTPGMVGNIYIFDSNGRQVLHLLKNSLIGENSSVSWDGRTTDNGLAPIGIYIVYIEVFDENGNTSKIKKTCVLAHQLD